MSARTGDHKPLAIIDPITKEKTYQCGRHGCGKFVKRLKGKYCKECAYNVICPHGSGGHRALQWTVSPCSDGTVFAKCGDCKRGYILTYPPKA